LHFSAFKNWGAQLPSAGYRENLVSRELQGETHDEYSYGVRYTDKGEHYAFPVLCKHDDVPIISEGNS
jgi:hypothetical protein